MITALRTAPAGFAPAVIRHGCLSLQRSQTRYERVHRLHQYNFNLDPNRLMFRACIKKVKLEVVRADPLDGGCLEGATAADVYNGLSFAGKVKRSPLCAGLTGLCLLTRTVSGRCVSSGKLHILGNGGRCPRVRRYRIVCHQLPGTSIGTVV